jgi:long-chain acyl-CoA synthetase
MGGSSSVEQTFEYSVPITPQDQIPGQSLIYRGSDSELMTETPFQTLADAFDTAVARFGHRRFIGTREIDPDGTLGHYAWKSYSTINAAVHQLQPHLVSLVPRNEEGLAFFGIYMKNREEWVITDIACCGSDITTVPLYETLGAESVKFIIN